MVPGPWQVFSAYLLSSGLAVFLGRMFEKSSEILGIEGLGSK